MKVMPATAYARWTVVSRSHIPTRLTRTPRPIELHAELDRLTPRTDIPDLLVEVQKWTG